MSQNENTKKYDLEKRTQKFGIDVIEICRKLKPDHITRPLISQLIKSSSSVGANYAEADDAETPRDFKHKIAICKKEARESEHFLRLLVSAQDNFEKDLDNLAREAKELNLIFNAIFRKVSLKLRET